MLIDISNRIKLLVSSAGFTYCNCLFIDDDIKAIIDTGADKKSLEEVKPQSIDMVINSHHHYDHIRGNQYFKNSEIKIHSLDYLPLQNRDEFDFYNSFDQWEELMPGVDSEKAGEELGIYQKEILPNLRADSTFEDNDVFDFGHVRMEVVHTPGHSAGHCSFYFPYEDFMFTGDICLTKAGPWYGEVYASADDMVNSINRIIEMKPKRISSCHINEVCNDSVARLSEFRDRIDKREERIYKYLKTTAADYHQIAGQNLIYRLHPSPFVLFWEKLMVLKHLDRLEKDNRIEKIENGLYRAR